MDQCSRQTFGVYQIKCLPTEKVYVGSTRRSFYARWYDWKFELRRGRCHNQHLQRAWSKHGEDNFVFSVLEICLEKDIIEEREQYWIDKLKPEFNNRPNAGSNLGRKATREQRLKNSIAHKGQIPHNRGVRRVMHCSCGKPVKEKYSQNGVFKDYYKTCGSQECIHSRQHQLRGTTGQFRRA